MHAVREHKIWRVVCPDTQKHAYFTASLCNVGLGSSSLTYAINKFPEISEKNK